MESNRLHFYKYVLICVLIGFNRNGSEESEKKNTHKNYWDQNIFITQSSGKCMCRMNKEKKKKNSIQINRKTLNEHFVVSEIVSEWAQTCPCALRCQRIYGEKKVFDWRAIDKRLIFRNWSTTLELGFIYAFFCINDDDWTGFIHFFCFSKWLKCVCVFYVYYSSESAIIAHLSAPNKRIRFEKPNRAIKKSMILGLNVNHNVRSKRIAKNETTQVHLISITLREACVLTVYICIDRWMRERQQRKEIHIFDIQLLLNWSIRSA